jgi:hypothetical protein
MLTGKANISLTEETCAGCRICKSSWKGNCERGYPNDEEMYCCQDCSEGIEDICNLEV